MGSCRGWDGRWDHTDSTGLLQKEYASCAGGLEPLVAHVEDLLLTAFFAFRLTYPTAL